MSLRRTQALFWRAITWPTGIDDFLAQADADTRAAFEATFAQTPAFGRRERMTVYAESYFWRLADVLRDQFKVASWLVGDVRFHNLATDFVLGHPSQNPDIRRLGGVFLAFMRDHPLAQEVEGLVELAEVDWSTVTALDAPDGSVLDAEALRAIPLPQWPGLRLAPSEGLRLWTTRRSYPRLWTARDRGDASPRPIPAPDAVPHHVLVWRHRHDVFHRSVAAPEARALRALIEGQPFSEICVAAAGPGGDEADANTVVGWLTTWLSRGLIGAKLPSAAPST